MQETEQSGIVYNVTLSDLVAFNLYHFKHSPTIRKMQWRATIIYSIFSFCFTFGILSIIRSPIWPALCGALGSVIWTLCYMRYYQTRGYIKRLSKMVRQMYAEDKNPGTLGQHTLSVDADGFTDITDYQHKRFSWGGLVRIENEPGYTYLYTGSQSAFVIPHQSITSGNFKAVLEQIGRHYQPDGKLNPVPLSQ